MKIIGDHVSRHTGKYTVGALIFIVVAFYLILPKFFTYLKDDIELQGTSVVAILNETQLSSGGITVAPTDTLRPIIKIKLEESSQIQSAQLDGMDILSSTAFVRESNGNDFAVTPVFLMTPGEHILEIITEDGEESFNFNLNLDVGFDTSIKKSEFFVIPDSTEQNHPDNWYVKDGKLRLDELNDPPLASIAFLYPFKDIDLTFTFKPTGEVTNLVFYFLERGRSVVIGNGNSSRITLLRGNEEKVEGEDFFLQAGVEYKARVVRVGNEYNLYLAEIAGDWQHVLSYKDLQDTSTSDDSVGFSVWPGGNGIEIDDLSFFATKP